MKKKVEEILIQENIIRGCHYCDYCKKITYFEYNRCLKCGNFKLIIEKIIE